MYISKKYIKRQFFDRCFSTYLCDIFADSCYRQIHQSPEIIIRTMKNKITPLFKICLVVLFLLLSSAVRAGDSLRCDMPRQETFDDCHRLKAVDIVVPAALIGVSALYIENGWMVRQKRAVKYAVVPKDRHKVHVDDYVQYAPVGAVYGLNLAGLRGRHSFKDRTIMLAMSYATMGIIVNTMKFAISERRPDVSTRNSFPSGHTATAFMGAQFLYEEYKSVSPLIAWSGYAVAATTAYLRIYNDRHWINDVVAGACIGIVSTKLAYKLYPLLFRKSACRRSKVLAALPYYDGSNVGVSMSMTF